MFSQTLDLFHHARLYKRLRDKDIIFMQKRSYWKEISEAQRIPRVFVISVFTGIKSVKPSVKIR